MAYSTAPTMEEWKELRDALQLNAKTREISLITELEIQRISKGVMWADNAHL